MSDKEQCKNCRFHFKNECIFNPPKFFPAQAQNPLTQEVQMQLIKMPVQVADDGWCGRYQAKRPQLSTV